MDIQKSKKILCNIAIAYVVLAILIFVVAGEGFKKEAVVGSSLSQVAVIGEIVDGMVVEQPMQVNADEVHSFSIQAATFARDNTGSIIFTFLDSEGNELDESTVDISELEDGQFIEISMQNVIEGMKGNTVTVRIHSCGCSAGNAVTFYYGNMVKAGKFEISKKLSDAEKYEIDGVTGAGALCAYFSGVNNLAIYKLYWPIVLGILCVAIIVCRYWWKQMQDGKNNPLSVLCQMLTKYNFLIQQLVGRDFKTKYKRSFLGVGWSVLNPLLTMTVQYIVFSTLFRSGTKNYPVYLLTGIVFYSFFNEAVSLGMTSITGNAALIKKVYMPKYIYPVSRVLSSLINLGTSMIPLMAVMLLTGIWPKPALLLLVYDIICLLVFVIGMVLLMSTCMTFFQDTQFLWSVVSMIWMYMTPIFYTENIIPSQLLGLYRMNPLYQYITFARICIIDGATPGPAAYLWCALSAIVVFVIGVTVFQKNQNKFVLYI